MSQTTVDAALLIRIISSSVTDRAGQDIPVSDTLSIGRAETCEIVLADKSVSRRHATVEPTPEGLKVTDLGTQNGVWIGTRKVEHFAVLEPGQRFQIGSTTFECIRAAVAAPVALGDAVSKDAPTMFMASPYAEPAGIEPEAPPAPKAFTIKIVKGTKKGTEVEVTDGAATLGRAPDCTIIFDERDISRKHARIDSTPDGLLLTDLNSSMGVRVGTKSITTQLLKPGDQVRLGDTVTLECVLAGAAAPAPVEEAVSPDATMFAPAEPAAEAVSPDATLFAATADMPAVVAPPPTVVPPDPPRAHLQGATGAFHRSELVARPASTDGVTDDDFSHTVVIRLPDLMPSEPWSIDKEGELIDFLAHKPLLLDDPEHVWYVVSGGVLIFTCAVENGQAVGQRTHFLGILPGQCFFGFDIAAYGLGSGFLAVAKQGTQVRKVKLSRLREIAADAAQRTSVAGLIDNWVTGLSSALVKDLPTKRTGELKLKPGERVEVATKDKATAAESVVWLDISSGSIMFDDMATPTFPLRRTLFPLTTYSWIQPLSEEFGALVSTPMTTTQALGDGASWAGLDVFHSALCESEFISKKLATVDEYVRLQEKAHQSAAAADAGYDAIGSVLRTDAATPQAFRATGSAEPVMRAIRIVADALGMEIRDVPMSEEEQALQLTFEDRVTIISSTAGFRTRVVALRDTWWTRDQGPMLGQITETKQPVALLPDGPNAYFMVDPATGDRQKITAEVGASISAFAFMMYRPLPEGVLKLIDVVKFGARGLKGDMRWVMMMAVVVGMFGMVTPYITGQVFDVAVPQADRTMLYGFGAGLIASAIATALFKLTQGIATLRMQVKMSSAIQAAVWDRMLNLPVNFFRKYSAGDLADRAAGVDAIQDLVAGAGVAAILGSISGSFYVFQMFGYDMKLAMAAIGLTITFVSVNMLCNYAQLRSQREEIQLRGRITGLVLNLVTGVSKLRICGAEQHAFRVWATQFAQQRKITFRTGTIQNIAAVFASVFPIISSMIIFTVMISAQATQAAGEGLTTGEFVAFNAAYGLFMAAMQALGDASLSLLRVVPIWERLIPILTTPPETDKSKSFPGKLTGAIELSHLHFRYTPDGPFIVKDVSLKIKAGEFVAFVGESGCGKSTLMRLMLGFESPSSGSIYFDGQELGSLDLRMVRQQMGVVMQQSRVMPCEIYRNIVGASSRTLDEAWEAAEKGGFADDIRSMPMGMHTYVSEGGGTLSGGQRQRLMICRAIVNKPKILFLDEATSALDNRTQAIVTDSMNNMKATRIVIAHRLSTIQNADKICYCKAGQIVESGTYDELMAMGGLFAELARRQVA